jgi:D-alanine-D-alanine ligase
MSAPKLRVAVVFGGRSSEHVISCLSAGSVLTNLDSERFEAIPVGITTEGGWVLGTQNFAELELHGRELPTVSGGRTLVLAGDPTRQELISLEPGAEAEVFAGVDVVFPVLHGAFGEDGTIQGLLELSGIPYVGAGVLASAIAMDKIYAKKILASEGISVGEYAVLPRNQSTLDQEDRERLGLPVFVKPSRAGSSAGITKVTDWADLDAAIAFARTIDPKVLVEKSVVGREVECAVLEFPDGRVETSLPAEIQVPAGDYAWYDFESKYLDESFEVDIPAKLDDAIVERLQATAKKAFLALDAQGLARVDFFITPEDELIVNEVNTMPGFTATSAYPKMWSVTGVDYPTLLSTLIDTALARGTGLR